MIAPLIRRTAHAVTCVVCALSMNGCEVAMMAATVGIHGTEGAGILNSAGESKVVVTIDEKTFTPEVRNTLLNAKHWAMMAGSAGEVRAAELVETRGEGIRVSLDRQTPRVREMIPSERGDTLRRMCSTFKSDVSLLSYSTGVDQGSQWQCFSGRMTVNFKLTTNVLDCRADVIQTFEISGSYNSGCYNKNRQAEADEMINKEIANRVLLALGK